MITTPNGMVKAERWQYQRRVQAAVDLFWHYYRLPQSRKPLVYLGFDEATCAHLVYLYSVTRDRLGGNPENAFRALGRSRKVHGTSLETLSLRIASIDIGGGTSDLAIADWSNDAKGPVADLKCVPLCHEGVSVAGDEVIRRIIVEIIMPSIVKAAESHAGTDVLKVDHLKSFFGQGLFEKSAQFRLMKKDLARQVWIPMAQSFLEHASSTEGDFRRYYQFYELFKNLPHGAVLQSFSEYVERVVNQQGGFHFRLDTIEWIADKNDVNKVIYNTLFPALRIFSEAIAQYGCDLVVIGGKLSALPIVREMLVRLCPVPPSRIISLTDFESGEWYPFDLALTRIRDAKTTVAVGAALWFFAEKLKALPQFSVSVDRKLIESAELFIGELSGKQILSKSLLFPQKLATKKYVSLAAPTFLGSRFIDCDASHANILYELSLTSESTANTPVQVFVH